MHETPEAIQRIEHEESLEAPPPPRCCGRPAQPKAPETGDARTWWRCESCGLEWTPVDF